MPIRWMRVKFLFFFFLALCCASPVPFRRGQWRESWWAVARKRQKKRDWNKQKKGKLLLLRAATAYRRAGWNAYRPVWYYSPKQRVWNYRTTEPERTHLIQSSVNHRLFFFFYLTPTNSARLLFVASAAGPVWHDTGYLGHYIAKATTGDERAECGRDKRQWRRGNTRGHDEREVSEINDANEDIKNPFWHDNIQHRERERDILPPADRRTCLRQRTR